MAGKVATVWVEAGTDPLRASRINEVSAGKPGQLALRVVSHRNPVVIVLEGITDPKRTARFADRLLALIERHSQPRAASVLIGYQRAAERGVPGPEGMGLDAAVSVQQHPAARGKSAGWS